MNVGVNKIFVEHDWLWLLFFLPPYDSPPYLLPSYVLLFYFYYLLLTKWR